MLSDDLTMLARSIGSKAAEVGRNDPLYPYLMRMAERLQNARDEAILMQDTSVPVSFRCNVIDLTSPNVVPFPRVCLPPPYGGDNDGSAA